MDLLVSIIVPIFNAEQYLEQCLNSLLGQSYKKFELLLIDDGSTDKSGIICDNFQLLDSRIKVFHLENGGVCKARNIGMQEAKGIYFLFVDADDILLADAVENLVEARQFSKADLILGNCKSITDGHLKNLVDNQSQELIGNSIYKEIKHFALWGYLFDAGLIKKHTLFFVEGLAYSEDLVFICNYLLFVSKVYLLDKDVYYYRINPNSVSNNKEYYKKILNQFKAFYFLDKLGVKYKDNICFSALVSKLKREILLLGLRQYSNKYIKISDVRKVYLQFFDICPPNIFYKILFMLDFFRIYLSKNIKLWNSQN